MARIKPNVLFAGAVTAGAALLVDQWSKGSVFTLLRQGEELTLAPMVSLVPGMNDGAAFGLAREAGPWPLILIALVVTVWLAALLLRSRSVGAGIALGAVIGGALANVTDRMRFSAVRDFIDVHWNSAHWPTFNMADVFVVTGLLLYLFVEHSGEAAQTRSSRKEA